MRPAWVVGGCPGAPSQPLFRPPRSRAAVVCDVGPAEPGDGAVTPAKLSTGRDEEATAAIHTFSVFYKLTLVLNVK